MNLPNSVRVDAQVLAILRGTPETGGAKCRHPQEQNVATPERVGSKMSPPPGAKCRSSRA
jgi:hypothetical protein